MSKNKPVEVIFRQDVLDKLKADYGICTPQDALEFMERLYDHHYDLSGDKPRFIRSGQEGAVNSLKNDSKDGSKVAYQIVDPELEEDCERLEARKRFFQLGSELISRELYRNKLLLFNS